MPRINQTGRRRIRHQHVEFIIHPAVKGSRTFSGSLQLGEYGFPDDAHVFVEAYWRTAWMRWQCGLIGTVQNPTALSLDKFAEDDPVLFRVKVVSASEPRGRLLGLAPRVPWRRAGEDAAEREGLLPARSADLGKEVWQISFESEPVLEINRRAGSKDSVVRSPGFRALVLPAAMRSILTRLILLEKHRSVEGEDDWRDRWLSFAQSLPGCGPLEGDEDLETDSDWIDRCVESFCSRMDAAQLYLSEGGTE